MIIGSGFVTYQKYFEVVVKCEYSDDNEPNKVTIQTLLKGDANQFGEYNLSVCDTTIELPSCCYKVDCDSVYIGQDPNQYFFNDQSSNICYNIINKVYGNSASKVVSMEYQNTNDIDDYKKVENKKTGVNYIEICIPCDSVRKEIEYSVCVTFDDGIRCCTTAKYPNKICPRIRDAGVEICCKGIVHKDFVFYNIDSSIIPLLPTNLHIGVYNGDNINSNLLFAVYDGTLDTNNLQDTIQFSTTNLQSNTTYYAIFQLENEIKVVPFTTQNLILEAIVIPNDLVSTGLAIQYKLDSSAANLQTNLEIDLYERTSGSFIKNVYNIFIDDGNLEGNLPFNTSGLTAGHYMLVFKIENEISTFNYIKK